MATLNQEIIKLKQDIRIVERVIFNLVKETTTTTNTNPLYWALINKQMQEAYEDLRTVTGKWFNTVMPAEYEKQIALNIKNIKALQFGPGANVGLDDILNTQLSRESITVLLDESLKSIGLGLENGERRINELLRVTQQINIGEAQVNQVIGESFATTGNYQKSAKILQKELMKSALDKQYITIINKNGDPMRFNASYYAELVARTKIREAQTIATLNTARAYDTDLVQVSAHNTETPYDMQFEGKIFSISGNHPMFPPAFDLPPFHPNCKHVITVVFQSGLMAAGSLEKMADFSNSANFLPPEAFTGPNAVTPPPRPKIPKPPKQKNFSKLPPGVL